MRVLHTSDWHIGRRFKGIDLLEYQRKALEWLIGLIKREQVDVCVCPVTCMMRRDRLPERCDCSTRCSNGSD